MPYDFLYILNQFFYEMTKALAATNGHYAQFAGDGLMALYGLNAKDPATGAADALRGHAKCWRAWTSSTADLEETCCNRCASESAFISARPLSARWDRHPRKSSQLSAKW
jgi:class 3 adenylate cyclase